MAYKPNMEDIKKLRTMTGAGLADVKKALTESEGDFNKAMEIIREKGQAIAAKRSDRETSNGCVLVKAENGFAAIIALKCETDFVANGEKFVTFVKSLAEVVAKQNPADVDALMKATWVDGKSTVEDAKNELFLALRENMNIRRFFRIEGGVSVPYVHMKGKIGVLVNLEVEGCDATEIGSNVAMQIAALNPRFWDKSQVSDDVLAEEKQIMMAQMDNDPKMAGKPEQVKEKIVVGKLNKFYSENCLLQQEFVRGDVFTGTVEQYIADAAKKLGGKIDFVDAVRFEKGEGIEKKQENFAEEIASMIKG